MPKKYYLELDGEMLCVSDYCKKLGYNYTAIQHLRNRYKLTWEKAIEKYLENKNKRVIKDKRLANIWRQMKYRCYNPKNKSYKWYGERGITVQKSWLESYFNFEDDMYESYIEHCNKYGEKDTTLDRINYNGNYELNNLRWATYEEQANNKRNNFIVVDNLTLMQFSEKYNLPVSTVWYRIHHGWSVEKIITTPVRKSTKINFPTGESLLEVSKRLGISKSTLHHRIEAGWSLDEIIHTPVKQKSSTIILSTGETVTEASERLGINRKVILYRLKKGQTIEEIETIPVKRLKEHYLPCNKRLKPYCEENGYNYKLICSYIKKYDLEPHEALAKYLKGESFIQHYLPCNNNQTTLRQHCKANKYSYETVILYINKYSLSPHEALARYLKNRQKKKD